MTVPTRRCRASFHRPEGRLRSAWPRFAGAADDRPPSTVRRSVRAARRPHALGSAPFRLDDRLAVFPRLRSASSGWSMTVFPEHRSAGFVRSEDRPPPTPFRSVRPVDDRRPSAAFHVPRPARGPSGFGETYRDDELAYRGLSYMGIRASIRQVLPRRLEPILSWVFTSLRSSPLLPRPRRLRGLLSRT
jgi:hypothetical protein